MIYAVALTPLVKSLRASADRVCQGWYADDSAAAGKFGPLRVWYDNLKTHGEDYGSIINESKTQSLVKPGLEVPGLEVAGLEVAANEHFGDTAIVVKTDGVRYLGAGLGTSAFCRDFAIQRAEEWIQELNVLKEFAAVEPHPAYAAMTQCVMV